LRTAFAVGWPRRRNSRNSFLETFQLRFAGVLQVGEHVPSRALRPDQLVELELQRLAVPVLRRLDEDLQAFLLQRGLPDLGEVRAHAPIEVFLWGLKEAEAISIARAGALRRPSRCSDARNERREPGDRTSDDANRGELVRYRRWSATMEGLLARRV